MKLKVGLTGRDSIEVDYEGEIPSLGSLVKVSLRGCHEFLSVVQEMRRQFGADIKAWPVPEGAGHAQMLLRELVLKLNGQWAYPYDEEELCHCRNIPTKTVDEAVISGAHTPEIVSRQTTASTACGTCRPQVQKIIDYRLNKKVS